MPLLNQLITAISKELVRTVSGRLFTEKEIRVFSAHAVGKYFVDWLPEPEEEKAARERVEEAREYIGKASAIITDMQADLVEQNEQLDQLLETIKDKKALAERYEQLANTNQAQFHAFRQEMEEALRQKLIEQSKNGRKLRQAASITISLFTLIAGAALGAYFKDIVHEIQQLVSQS